MKVKDIITVVAMLIGGVSGHFLGRWLMSGHHEVVLKQNGVEFSVSYEIK